MGLSWHWVRTPQISPLRAEIRPQDAACYLLITIRCEAVPQAASNCHEFKVARQASKPRRYRWALGLHDARHLAIEGPRPQNRHGFSHSRTHSAVAVKETADAHEPRPGGAKRNAVMLDIAVAVALSAPFGRLPLSAAWRGK